MVTILKEALLSFFYRGGNSAISVKQIHKQFFSISKFTFPQPIMQQQERGGECYCWQSECRILIGASDGAELDACSVSPRYPGTSALTPVDRPWDCLIYSSTCTVPGTWLIINHSYKALLTHCAVQTSYNKKHINIHLKQTES